MDMLLLENWYRVEASGATYWLADCREVLHAFYAPPEPLYAAIAHDGGPRWLRAHDRREQPLGRPDGLWRPRTGQPEDRPSPLPFGAPAVTFLPAMALVERL